MYEIIGPHSHITLSSATVSAFAALIIWELIWKLVALWKAGRNRQLGWFIAMTVFNTLGILEMVYIYFFQKDNNDRPKTE
jgi:predicted permease